MRIPGIIISLAFILTVCACNPSAKKDGSAPSASLKKGFVDIDNYGTCDPATNGGVAVNIKMWLPSDSSEVSLKISSALNRKVIERINSYADSASIAANPGADDSRAESYRVFAKNYNDFKKEFPEAPGCWEVELEGDTIMVTPKVLTYQLNHYAFTGGAHPNSFKSLHVFDAITGEEKDLRTFISDTLALLKKVETEFKKVEKLASDVNLEEEGYFLKNNQFFLPANYVFTRKGILFYYNPYEIAPYVKGPIEFTITFQELSGLVKKELIF